MDQMNNHRQRRERQGEEKRWDEEGHRGLSSRRLYAETEFPAHSRKLQITLIHTEVSSWPCPILLALETKLKSSYRLVFREKNEDVMRLITPGRIWRGMSAKNGIQSLINLCLRQCCLIALHFLQISHVQLVQVHAQHSPPFRRVGKPVADDAVKASTFPNADACMRQSFTGNFLRLRSATTQRSQRDKTELV